MKELEQLRAQLAEAQAENVRLREALEKSRSVFDTYVKLHRDKTPPDAEKAARNAFHRGVCEEALSLPSDTTALEALIAKAGEVMREKCLDKACGWIGVDEAIRALPGVTMVDLK